MISKALLISSLLLLASGCSNKDPGSHYRRHHDGESLYVLLSRHIKAGDSYSKVSNLLGNSQVSPNTDKFKKAMVEWSQQYPAKYPDGLEDEDVFYDYPIEKKPLFKPRRTVVVLSLQFRKGLLVNHMPEDYQEYDENDFSLIR